MTVQETEASQRTTKAVRVCVRVRPSSPREGQRDEEECLSFDGDRSRVILKDSKSIKRQQQCVATTRAFAVDGYFEGSDSSNSIYASFVADTVEQFLQGYNGTVIAYGQTGSGKTYTMFGGTAPDTPTNKGIIRQACEQVFQGLSRNLGSQISVLHASGLELYNEQLFDLSLRGRKKPLTLLQQQHCCSRGTGETTTAVLGLQEYQVQSVEELMAFIEKCAKRRTTAETQMNSRSSRSHVVFSLMLKTGASPDTNRGSAVSEWTVSKLRLVDLAGSERNKKSGATGKNFEEAKHINSGLLALGNVIHTLSEDKTSGKAAKQNFVPYRDSKLTRLLQDSLEGNSLTSFIACVRASGADYDETNNTLTYACRARKIQTTSMRTVIETTKETEFMGENGPPLQQRLLVSTV